MKLGLQVVKFNWPGSPGNVGETLGAIGKAAEAAGFDSLWVMDHFFQMDMPQMGFQAEEPMFDGYTVLSYLAPLTKRINLGAMVTGVNYRHPGHLLKIVSNLDVLSGGRVILGIGAGWYEREALGLGFPFPPLKERFEMLEETLQIFKQVWSGDISPFNGRHYQLAEPLNNPQPLNKPHPPILIGGTGEKKTLRMVAQYADACNFLDYIGVDGIAHKLQVLRKHCEDLGRDYEEIEKTVLGFVDLSEGDKAVEELITSCRRLSELGVESYYISVRDVHELHQLETIGREVVPVVSKY